MPQRGIGLQPKVGAPAPTLGSRSEMETTATRLWPIGVEENGMAATALRLGIFADDDPG